MVKENVVHPVNTTRGLSWRSCVEPEVYMYKWMCYKLCNNHYLSRILHGCFLCTKKTPWDGRIFCDQWFKVCNLAPDQDFFTLCTRHFKESWSQRQRRVVVLYSYLTSAWEKVFFSCIRRKWKGSIGNNRKAVFCFFFLWKYLSMNNYCTA